MSVAEADIAMTGAEPQGLALDPFAYVSDVASRIPGLGGNAPGHDPAYTFHTAYVEAAPGPCRFTVRFDGLRARRGVLQLRVHMIPVEEGAHARAANMDRIQLNRLAAMGGEISIGFEGFPGFRFAALGLIAGDTDVEADGIRVVLDRPADPHARADHVGDGRTSSFGRDAARPATQLISTEPPTLASPVCQLATAAQLAEPAFRAWEQRLDLRPAGTLSAWRDAYILQALRRYGMLAPGARGIGFDLDGMALASAIAEDEAEILVTTSLLADAGAADAGAAGEGPPESGRLAPHVTARAIDHRAIPADLVDFDFAISDGCSARLGSVQAMPRFVEAVMNCLRPGGLAVHMFPFDLAASGGRTVGDEMLFAREHIDRLALVLISRKHEVAQIKIDRRGALVRRDVPDDEVGAFGFIARRAPSIL